jgi:dTDP-4-dehydrorhamnose 3,5-epimerase
VIFTAVEAIPGAWIVDGERHVDERGWFARTFARDEFASRGLASAFVESSISFNHAAFTLRGMHLQHVPHAECKLIRCSRGRVFDVMVDTRPESAGYGQWAGFELDSERGRLVYLPEGVAHGFLTLVDDSELSYQISAAYVPESAGGFRWDDPAVGIAWPCAPTVMSERDRGLPMLADLIAPREEIR